jgi:hypothetical protein
MLDNFELTYRKTFSDTIDMLLYLNTDDNRFYTFVQTKVMEDGVIIRGTGQQYEPWEKHSAIQEIDSMYEAYILSESKKEIVTQAAMPNLRPDSVEALQYNMKEMAAFAIDNFRCQ